MKVKSTRIADAPDGCGVRERERKVSIMISRILARGTSWIELSLAESGETHGEAGLVGADQEFSFGCIKFEMPVRQTQEYADMAARNKQVEFRR